MSKKLSTTSRSKLNEMAKYARAPFAKTEKPSPVTLKQSGCCQCKTCHRRKYDECVRCCVCGCVLDGYPPTLEDILLTYEELLKYDSYKESRKFVKKRLEWFALIDAKWTIETNSCNDTV